MGTSLAAMKIATASPSSNIGDISERSREHTEAQQECILLGSFSNYLVTKSSVPLMAIQKKLKHTKKFAKTNIRQPNNLTTSAQAGSSAGPKVD
ncbi:hypothetical protein B9Z19DRAFT_1130569 [Tuber borchii]|uniref:Uncharacterized protein n=1 Tax=Tuber borchii TaxID=42251 RepID=A0A2T6ZKD7_TUBBO|nr:hypothetical protein B9Z19DRAFT_1130569 [Tuber borchii]